MQGVVRNIPNEPTAQSQEYAVGVVCEATGAPRWQRGVALVIVGSGLAIIDTGPNQVGETYHRERGQTPLAIQRPNMPKRKDLITLRANLHNRSFQIFYVEGAGPRAPKPENSDAAIDLPLAELTVTDGGEIDVKDLRVWYNDLQDMAPITPDAARTAGIEMVTD